MLTQDQIDAIPGQPDGIEDDSRDMPDPARAAERILTYVETFGDGLYSVASDGSPLYGRDLCSVAQAVKKLLAELDQLRGQYDTLLEDAERFRALARSMADERDRLRVQASQSDADHRAMDARATELEAQRDQLRQQAQRLNVPMVARLRHCAADTSSNWDGTINIYPPEARGLVALIDAAVDQPVSSSVASTTEGDQL